MPIQGYQNIANKPARGGKTKAAIIGASSLFLVAMVVAVAVGVGREKSTSATSASSHISSTTKAIKAVCEPTDYTQTCETALTSAAANETNPKELIKAAFRTAANEIGEAAKNSTMLNDLSKDPITQQALENCRELMQYSVDELQASFDKLGEFRVKDVNSFVDDLKAWLSAAITYQETCLDGFENTTGTAGEEMKKALKTSGELTRNGLAMVSQISSLISDLQLPDMSRMLVEGASEDGTPAWVGDEKLKLMAATPATIKADVVVAKDGSGKYKTIGEALKEVPNKGNRTFVIYIKEGVYAETVVVTTSMTNVMMIGDGANKTRVSGHLNFIDGTQTFLTATFAALGNFFMAKDMGFENTAGAIKHQAVALRVQSDKSIFYNCQMDGYQDTLYAHAHRQFYRDCTITGTIDFIFGDAAAVFQNCKMVVRKPMEEQSNIVTAHGRVYHYEPTGLVLQNCHVVADPLLAAEPAGKFSTYLGRPWKEFSRAVFMQSQLEGLIHPDGWTRMNGNIGVDTCFFAEYGNKGPGSSQTSRVKWLGVRTLTPEQAANYTAGKFIDGDKWIPFAGLPYSAGMIAA